MRLIFYDFEVFLKDWMVVLIDYETRQEKVIVNDRDELVRVYLKNKDSIWIGYNSRMYDQWIMKAILLGMNPAKVNDDLILFNIAGYRAVPNANQIPFNNFDISTGFHSLKQLEAFMGNDVRESSVPFTLQRKLTDDEIQETIKYCRHDVQQTIEVFEYRKSDFDAQLGLIQAFNLDMSYFNKTKAQLSAHILGASKVVRDDEFDFTFVDTLKLTKYKYVLDWYADKSNRNYSKKLKTDVYGVDHEFAWGGLHGARKKYMTDGVLVSSDVSSFYPALMIEYNFLSRNVAEPSKYRQIRDDRLVLKANKDQRQLAYKLVINGVFGCGKDAYNPLYDPLMSNNVCINGQLLLLDLIEKIELTFGEDCELIQSNTDGVIFKLKDDSLIDKYISVCKEWEIRTRMELEHDFIERIIQRDVNSYIVIGANGKVKSKGPVVKKLSPIDNDLPIINQAIKEYYINGIPVEETINNCNELIKFQKIYKVTSAYKCAVHNGEELPNKVYRVFASKDQSNSAIYKLKIGKDTPDLFAGSPKHVFINNNKIIGEPVPDELDRQWYIDEAKKRIKGFTGEIL